MDIIWFIILLNLKNLENSYIPPYKHYSKLKKALNDEIILMSLVPHNYSSLKVFKNGRALYKEDLYEAMKIISWKNKV